MSAVPVELRSSVILAKLHQVAGVGEADAGTPGIYASVGLESENVYGYPARDRSNGPPVCSLSVNELPSTPIEGNIAVDRQGDLFAIGAVGSGVGVIVYAGPGLCGQQLGSIADPYGYPVDVAASRRVEGSRPRGEEIVVGNWRDFDSTSGSVSVCTLSGGCTANLTVPYAFFLDSVALALNGDCWASGVTKDEKAFLVYFAHCRGHGVRATGFQNRDIGEGALDIDDNGNLISFSTIYGTSKSESGELYIYSGCNPACHLVSGPLTLLGAGSDGHLDGRCRTLVVADLQFGQLDIYSYSASGIAYEYSITNGLTPSDFVGGAAFSPRCQE